MKSVDRAAAWSRRTTAAASFLSAVFRTGLFLTAACLVALGFLLRAVQADVTETLLGVGAQIMEYPGSREEAVRQLQLNGVSLSFRTQTVEASFADVLAHYETLCTMRDGGLGEQLTTLLSSHTAAPSNPGVLHAVTSQTSSNEGAGYVACLDMGEAPQGLEALARKFVRFSQTGNLHDIGELRYVLARRVASDQEEKTFLLTIWVDSSFYIHQMLPLDGADAEGRDPVGVPRPSGSQRVLSAWEAQTPSSVYVYKMPATSAAEVASYYRRELPRNGWTIVERNLFESMEIDGILILSAEKDNRFVTVLSNSDEPSRAMFTIVASEPS